MRKILLGLSLLFLPVMAHSVVYHTMMRETEGISIGASTSTLKTSITAIGVSTGTIQADLSAEVSNRGIADTAIGLTTATLRTDLNTLKYSTYTVASITLAPSQISAGALLSTVIASSVAVNSVPINAIQSGVLPATVIASSIAVSVVGVAQVNATGIAGASTFFRGDGSWSAPAGTGDVVLAATQTFTGGNTFLGSVNISSFTVTATPTLPLSGNGLNPVGSVITFISTTAPTGYLYCNGASVSTTTYSALFAVMGYTCGGSGANFTLPDFRGFFIRGFDDGAGQDPDDGGAIYTTQQDAMQGHRHLTIDTANRNCWPGGTAASNNIAGGGGSQDDLNTKNTGQPKDDGLGNGTPRISDQTRPKNKGMAYMIKY